MNLRGSTKPTPIAFQIAPMIDFLVVLLCYTISTQILTQWESEVDIKLPTAQSGNVAQRLPGEIIINIRQDGAMIVNRQVLDEPALGKLLARIVQLFPGQPVLIRADRETAYKHIISALDLCRRADVWNVSFATVGAQAQGT